MSGPIAYDFDAIAEAMSHRTPTVGAEADPVVALYADWYALNREMIAAYDRVPDEPGDANEAAQAEAEAVLERGNTLYEEIVGTAPTSFAGIIAAASAAVANLEQNHGLDREENQGDVALDGAYRILVNIARFGRSSSTKDRSRLGEIADPERLLRA
jgi:hypothetical protein